MDDLQARRIARNEARFREINERTRLATDELHGAPQDECTIMCECAVAECEDMITLPVEAYERARSSAERFIIRPDHIIVATERAIELHDDFWIVEKVGPGARVARELAT